VLTGGSKARSLKSHGRYWLGRVIFLVFPNFEQEENMKKKISPEFNKMVGKPLDVDKIKDLYKGPLRICEPGMMGTCDWVPERLNVHVDKKKLVRGFDFG
jgi:hypothetical protein